LDLNPATPHILVFMGETQLNLLQVVQGDQSELTEKLGVSSKDIFREWFFDAL
jgi:hypothetical protein